MLRRYGNGQGMFFLKEQHLTKRASSNVSVPKTQALQPLKILADKRPSDYEYALLSSDVYQGNNLQQGQPLSKAHEWAWD